MAAVDEGGGDSGLLRMSSAALRDDDREIQVLVRSLIETLGSVVGCRVEVRSVQGWLARIIGDIPFLRHRPRRILAASFTFDRQVFRIDLANGVRCTTSTVSAMGLEEGTRGVELREWSRTLGGVLSAHAESHAAARASLERLTDI
jgi:hypothetical protein